MKAVNSADRDFRFNIYMSGVGGQGIGVLSEVLLRAYDHAGFSVKGVDTHGLAQRGGVVQSHLRIGCSGGSPLIEPGGADLVLSLERTEAYRALRRQIRPGGSLVYFNTSWQSLGVRTGAEIEITADVIKREAARRDIRVYEVVDDRLPDVRMQNIVLLCGALNENVLQGINCADIQAALGMLFSGELLEHNLRILSCL